MLDAWFTVSLTDGDKLEIRIVGNCAHLKWRNPQDEIIEARKVDLPATVYENGAIWLYDFSKFIEDLEYGE